MTKNNSKEIKLSDHVMWQGEYNGISFQIHKWNREYAPETEYLNSGDKWNFYIFVKAREIILYDERVDYSAMYPDVEMNGGITYWQGCISSHNGKRNIDKIGCDYSHSWDYQDEGRGHKLKTRTVEEIMRDVKRTIDELPSDLR